ncbi:hypothetical protein MRX96_014716 [Rhipicephalus microplus]
MPSHESKVRQSASSDGIGSPDGRRRRAYKVPRGQEGRRLDQLARRKGSRRIRRNHRLRGSRRDAQDSPLQEDRLARRPWLVDDVEGGKADPKRHRRPSLCRIGILRTPLSRPWSLDH